MSRIPINIPESRKTEKLVSRKSLFEKILDILFELPFVLFLPFFGVMDFTSKISKQEPIAFSLAFLIFSFILGGVLIYSVIKMNSLQRINGISRGQNSLIIKQIAEQNNWKISTTNQQITVITFSWQETGTDWGKQITILYDKEDILVNCTSFGLFSTPSPFHWFANRKKVTKLKSEFNGRIKNVLQQRV